VIAPEQQGDADERGIRQRPGGIWRDHCCSRDVGENLPTLGVDTQEFRSTIEANSTEVLQECVSCAAGRSKGPMHGLTHPDDTASIGNATFKRYLMQRVSHPDVSTTV
jgi:hypothetical protein